MPRALRATWENHEALTPRHPAGTLRRVDAGPLTFQDIVDVLAVVTTVTLGVPTLLWLMRRTTVSRRALISVVAFALASLFYMRAEPRPWLTVVWFLLGVNAGLQLIELVVWDIVLRRWLHQELPRLLLDIFVFIGLAAATLLAFAYAAGGAVSVSDILVTSTVVSAVLGFALQPVLSNVFSGLALHLEGPFAVGDWVKLSGQEGQIVQMGWRATTLRTRENQFVTVPNGQVAGEDMLNYDRPSTLQALNDFVGVSYADAPAQVKELMIAAALDVPSVSREPRPKVYLEVFGDFALQYRIKYWITDYAAMPDIRDEVMTRIWYTLQRNGMTVPYPVRDVTLRPEPDLAGRAAADVDTRAATLRSADVLAPLSDEQIRAVAEGSRLAWYAPGESIVRQGDTGDSMFVIRSGNVTIEAVPEGGTVAVPIAQRGPGDFFGEMSLLTGAPRVATARAKSESLIVVVDKAAFAHVLLADAEVAEGLADVLAQRAADTQAIMARQAGAQVHEGSAAHFLRLIKTFFATHE